jgi:HlyD family secretion protein
LKMADLENQLAAARKVLEDYKVYAPFNGTISSVKAKEGDSLERGGALLSIRDFNQMQFTIPVDELDISKVEVGQEVSVTVDALSDTEKTPLTGEVIYKAMEGTSSNGVATYNVTIKINETKNLLAGMNANATIILQKSEDTLLVPLEAVTKIGDRAFVWVKGASENGQFSAGASNEKAIQPRNENANNTQSSGSENSKRSNSSGRSSRLPASVAQNMEYYANASRKSVEIGLTSDSYIEIKSGLSEGDAVILPPLVKASTGTSNAASGGFNMRGMGGGMGGGMSAPPNFQRNESSSSSRNRSTSGSKNN